MKGLFKRSLLALLGLVVTFILISCRPDKSEAQEIGRMMFYNVENLFDVADDPLTDDGDYTPDGELHWTKERYRTKRENIAWVISNIGGWEMPAIVGLSEVENRGVISDLLSLDTFRNIEYDYSVTESADPRGIDVALLWDKSKFKHIESREIPHYGALASFPLGRDPRIEGEETGSGRNTLWVTLEHRPTARRLNIFVMHNPSRRSGVRETDEKRMEVTSKVRDIINDIWHKDPSHNIVVMGDFNDNPSDRSLKKGLGAQGIEANTPLKPDRLYNLAFTPFNNGKGTHKFEGEFWMPDQIIVSGGMLLGDEPMVRDRQLTIFSDEELFTRKGNLRRTYAGSHYNGGYSDHLPVYIKLY